MKKILALFVFVLAISTSSQAQIDFGVGASYHADAELIGLQGKGYIGVTEALDLSPAFTLWLGDGANWSIDTDVHYKLLEIGESFEFNPFAGLSFINATDTDVAINIGASFKFALSSGAEIYIEPKFVIIDNSGFIVSAGYLF